MNSKTSSALRDFHTLFEVGAVGSLSNGQLLDRFLARRGEAAFEALIQRLGPMVWAVCLRVLRDHHDAEDAFQATFLVLARKAASIRPRDKVGHWLYGVAYQTARKARATRTKHRTREQSSAQPLDPEAPSQPPHDELFDHLDHELNRLPEKYRIPILLCELQGQTHQQAAAQLGWPVGTVSGRLSRAKALLASRLKHHEAALSAGSLATLLAPDPTSAAMPLHLISSTAQAASLTAAAMTSAPVAALTTEVLNAMFLTKLKLAGAVLLAVSLSGLGVVGVGVVTSAFGLSAIGHEARQSKGPSRAQELARPDDRHLQGTWIVTEVKQVSHQPTDEVKALLKSGKFTITIKGNALIYDSEKSYVYFHLDPTQSPKRMTLVAPGRGKIAPAIYKLDGDDLVIFQGRNGDKEPPSGFFLEDRQPGTFPTLLVLKRKDGDRKAGPDDVDEEKLRMQMAKARAETARRIYEQEKQRFETAHSLSVTDLAEWSRRWMEDEIQTRTGFDDTRHAMEDHYHRLEWLKDVAKSYAVAGQGPESDVLKVEYMRLEAQLKLTEYMHSYHKVLRPLHVADPDHPLPKIEEPTKAPEAPPEPPPPPPLPN